MSKEERDATLQRCTAEGLGTFIYVFLSAGAYTSVRLLAHSATDLNAPEWLFYAFGHGLSFFVASVIVGWISRSHINPAVTLGLAAVKQFPRSHVALQILAQFIGGLLGAGAVFIVYGRAGATTGLLGAEIPSPGTSLLQGCAVEGIGTAILTLTLVASKTNPKTSPAMSALAAGCSILVLTLFVGHSTGASFNPARALGPYAALAVMGMPLNWTNYIVIYLIGPLVGATVAGVVYTTLAHPPQPENAI